MRMSPLRRAVSDNVPAVARCEQRCYRDVLWAAISSQQRAVADEVGGEDGVVDANLLEESLLVETVTVGLIHGDFDGPSGVKWEEWLSKEFSIWEEEYSSSGISP